MPLISFFQQGAAESLFTEALSIIPNVGDTITYTFDPSDPEKWKPQALAKKKHAASLAARWKVVGVHHMIGRLSAPSDASQIVCVYIEPVVA